MYKLIKIVIVLLSIGSLLGACSSNTEQIEAQVEATQLIEVADIPAPTEMSTNADESTVVPVKATQAVEMETLVATEQTDESMSDLTDSPLPERSGPRTQTTGSVPHVQLDVEPIAAVNDELFRLAYALPGVENRPTVVSLPGASGMWLSDGVPVAHPEVIVSGREFAHIHPDGSLHAALPYERALELVEKGWGERHPWATEREGWDGFVMLFTPQSMDELDVIFQLIVESYNHTTGLTVQASDIE